MVRQTFLDVTKDHDWQILRKRLMNKWMSKPDWCCLQLRRYIGNMYTSDINKLKIVNMYLSSSGFRPGAINHMCITKLKQDMNIEIKKRKNKGEWK